MQTDSPSKSSERTPRVQSRRPFCVVAAWHRDLWSVNPPCLWRIPAFTSVSRVYFSCPGDTLSFINPEMALEAAWPTDGGMFLKGGNKAVSEKWGQKGKASHHPVTVRPSCSHLASSSDAEERGGLPAFGFDASQHESPWTALSSWCDCFLKGKNPQANPVMRNSMWLPPPWMASI